MTARALIKQDDVTRVMKGARLAGYSRVRLTIDQAGNIVVDASEGAAPLEDAPPPNPLDRLLRSAK